MFIDCHIAGAWQLVLTTIKYDKLLSLVWKTCASSDVATTTLRGDPYTVLSHSHDIIFFRAEKARTCENKLQSV